MIHSYALTCSQTLKQIILKQVLQTMDSIMIRNMIKKCKISSYQQFTFHSLDFMVSYWLILVVYMNNRKTRCTDNLLYYYSKRIDMIYKKQYFYISPESVCQCDVKRSTILQTAHFRNKIPFKLLALNCLGQKRAPGEKKCKLSQTQREKSHWF